MPQELLIITTSKPESLEVSSPAVETAQFSSLVPESTKVSIPAVKSSRGRGIQKAKRVYVKKAIRKAKKATIAPKKDAFRKKMARTFFCRLKQLRIDRHSNNFYYQ